MANKLDFENGRPTDADTDSDADANLCEECGAPVHPSLECKRCST